MDIPNPFKKSKEQIQLDLKKKAIQNEIKEKRRKAFFAEYKKLGTEKAIADGKAKAKRDVEGSQSTGEAILKPFAYFAKGVGKSLTQSSPQKGNKSDLRIVGENLASFVSGEDSMPIRHRKYTRYKRQKPKDLYTDIPSVSNLIDDEPLDIKLGRTFKKKKTRMDDLL